MEVVYKKSDLSKTHKIHVNKVNKEEETGLVYRWLCSITLKLPAVVLQPLSGISLKDSGEANSSY